MKYKLSSAEMGKLHEILQDEVCKYFGRPVGVKIKKLDVSHSIKKNKTTNIEYELFGLSVLSQSAKEIILKYIYELLPTPAVVSVSLKTDIKDPKSHLICKTQEDLKNKIPLGKLLVAAGSIESGAK